MRPQRGSRATSTTGASTWKAPRARTSRAATVITRSITKPGRYSGVFPFDDNAAWEKNAATLRQLYALRERLRALEKKS